MESNQLKDQKDIVSQNNPNPNPNHDPSEERKIDFFGIAWSSGGGVFLSHAHCIKVGW